jgi:hypothetical protein
VQTEFFLPAEAPKKDVEEVLAVGGGSGARLRDIPNVAFKLGKVPPRPGRRVASVGITAENMRDRDSCSPCQGQMHGDCAGRQAAPTLRMSRCVCGCSA